MADNLSISTDGKSARLTGKGTGNKTSVKMPAEPKNNIEDINIQGKSQIDKLETGTPKLDNAPVEMKVIIKKDIYFCEAKTIERQVVGHKIIKANQDDNGIVHLTLDNGHIVELEGIDTDVGAGTSISNFIAHPENFDNVITSVTAEGEKVMDVSGDSTAPEYSSATERWFILAGMNPIVGFEVDTWRGEYYYSYGIELTVKAPKK